MIIWNPWHGCHKVSEGCEHCYMYFLDSKRGLDTSHVFRTENFTMPIQRRRDGQFKLPSGMTLYVGLSTDFFVEEADPWRDEAWRIIRQRPDIFFRLLTKGPQLKPVFDAAMKAGLNLWDTATAYGMGESERILGTLAKEYERKDVEISTKFTPQIAEVFENSVEKMALASIERMGC